ncbi:glucosamine-6-phosphate deaminase [Brachybacterium sp. JHP9]|uniref:Glucosamine-6-phosphate deaminase n=1 Tax=Brachybacterium equifaecis TaxID=2910770 RepID=A0ABT0QVV5_9MICO|nr:glucosamine-6-phosphate deaminase [Brachybacterium equifaecis]MCL6421784.1 glucosamine-6-phosphate deaminase [Brachybacterium equifaecis]
MEIIIERDAEGVARQVADRFESVIRHGGRFGVTLGLATGSSPVATYQELIRRHREEGLSFGHARAFLLDEYVGIPRSHEQSYHRFIREHFTSHVDIADELVISPDGQAADPVGEAARYDRGIADAGGVDLQILGIGGNGHIGFNEPTSALTSRTRVKTLTEQTISDNARFFDSPEDVPVHVITQGLGTIMEARRIVLAATGESKASAIAAMIEGPFGAFCPATILQMHPAVTVVVDEDAAGELQDAEYYRFIQRQKSRLEG